MVPLLFDNEDDHTYDVDVVSVLETIFLKHGKLLSDPRRRTDIRRRSPRFIYYNDILYRQSFDGVLLQCLTQEEALQTVEEAHSGIFYAHQFGLKLHFWIKRKGYYWPGMVKDCMDYAQKCQACQFHVNFIHQPPKPLHPTVASWLFNAWGLDAVGPLAPKSSAGHSYILVATDYFSKQVEAAPLWEAYRTTQRTPTQATPYALVYGVEVVLSLERQIPTLRVAIQEGLTNEDNARLRQS
ncbi:hypothetical protein RJ639_011902 [Escallonia herrerae]|uniref:Integrase zinc-binding domain-containing protein n=1 Tax=Escallonia herrerae TaxID=1293975 RepID=A0AA89AQU1_9ASTE|nr:hypothetical protein RJ639_011902 [Escallonia herrerae]